MYKANENGLIEIMARKYDRGRKEKGKEKEENKEEEGIPPCVALQQRHARRTAAATRSPANTRTTTSTKCPV